MKLPSLVRSFGLVTLVCTISVAAPTAKLAQEGEAEFVSIAPNQWFDLLVQIDPGGSAIATSGLSVTVEGGAGAEFKAPILPPPGPIGYDQPFTVRVPTLLPDGLRRTLKAVVKGQAAGKDFTIEAERKLAAEPLAKGHVSGTARLKAPAVAGEPNAVVLTLSVIEPYHVYGTAGQKDGIPIEAKLVPGFDSAPQAAWTGGGPARPEGYKYEGGLSFEIPFTPRRAGKVNLRALVSWQACTDQICDPNELAYLPLQFDVEPGAAGATPTVAPSSTPAAPKGDLKARSLWQLALAAIGAGLFALAMPCTYPLIPITISFFTKQAEAQRHNGTSLALAYGAGIVAIFMICGVIVGQGILVFATLWWVNLIFALLFLYFGLSLIGLFEIRLPSFVNNWAGKASGSGGYLSVFAMGATLVITSFTCTAPFVGSLLVFAAAGGSTGTVAFAMAVFGLTMAIPFVFLSLSPKGIQALPRSGMWMKTLKVTLGIVELGLVLKFVSNIDIAIGTRAIGREPFLALWALSFLAAGLYLFDVAGLIRKGARWAPGKGRASFAALMLVIGLYLGSGVGGRGLVGVVEAFVPPNPTYEESFLAVAHEDYEEGLRLAREHNAPIFVHFTGFV